MDADERLAQNEPIGADLHARMLAGDLTAFAEIAEIYLPLITERLSTRFPNLDDPHLVDSAVVDALLNYQGNPNQYHPDKLRLDQYLYMSARGDLLNSLKLHKKDVILLPLAEIVELDDESSEYSIELEDISNVENEVLAKLSPTWKNVCSILPDLRDQEILQLMMDGIRDTSIFAEILNISHIPYEEQARIVKQHKDRIKKKITRHLNPSDLKL